MDDYRAIAQQVAEDIFEGRLQPGDRLPPQRTFAYHRGIAPSTASRVYSELARRGLVSGETGRGTFVRFAPPAVHPALAEPPKAVFNLETTYPVLDDQQTLLAPVLRQIANSPEALHRALRETPIRSTVSLRNSVAHSLSGDRWRLDPNALVFTGNGRQAIAATFSSIASVGDRIGFDALTYPVAKAIATRLGIVAVPLALDEHGLRPDAVEAAHRAAPLKGIYTQATVHNPLGITMPDDRRKELAQVAEQLNGPVLIEDAIYAFLDASDPAPLAAYAPRHAILLDSLSKRIGPGLTFGIIAAPDTHLDRISAAVAAGAWGAAGFALEVGSRWLADGTIAELVRRKRADAAERQQVAKRALAKLAVRAHPNAYFLFVELPDRLRAATLVDAAAAQGVAISPASVFAVSEAHAPNAVRIGLANLDLAMIEPVLSQIAKLIGPT